MLFNFLYLAFVLLLNFTCVALFNLQINIGQEAQVSATTVDAMKYQMPETKKFLLKFCLHKLTHDLKDSIELYFKHSVVYKRQRKFDV